MSNSIQMPIIISDGLLSKRVRGVWSSWKRNNNLGQGGNLFSSRGGGHFGSGWQSSVRGGGGG